MEKKDRSIETLRGLAIILVIGLHITNDGALASSKTLYEYLSYTFQNVRIPLFTIISGYLYGVRPVFGRGMTKFIRGKFRRIFIPLFFVASAEYLAKGLTDPTVKEGYFFDVWQAFLMPYEHFWFLQVIFLIFLIYGFLGWVGWLPVWKNWIYLLFFSSFIFVAYPFLGLSLNYFSVGAVTYLLPFFTLGFGIARYGCVLFSGRYIYIWIFVFMICFFWQQFLWVFDFSEYTGKRTLDGLLLSISAGGLLFYYRRSVGFLAFIGSYAYTIYLYQGFGISLARKVGFEGLGPHLYFVLVIGFSILFGVLAEEFFKRIPYLRVATLGLRNRKREVKLERDSAASQASS